LVRMEQKKKLRIAVLIKRFVNIGGAEKYAVEITKRLRSKGHHIDLYAREADDELLGSINFFRVANRLTFSSVLNSYSFAKDVALKLKAKTYDVIHSHERGYLQDISTVHTFPYRKGVEEYSLLKKIDQIYLSPRSWLHLWLESKQMKAFILASVSWTIKDYIEKYYRQSQRITVITPGVDIEWFHPHWVTENRERFRKESGITDKDFVVLFVGSEFRRKGLDDLIPSIGVGFRLLVVGAGERHRHYQRLANRCGVSSRVEFKGLSDNIRKYYAIADVVVLPSLAEAFGMSILEGMSCGLPVVVSLRAGVSALIKDGVNGFTFQNSARLPEIFGMLLDPELRKSLGDKARKTAETQTWDTVADQYEKIYYQVAEKKRAISY